MIPDSSYIRGGSRAVAFVVTLSCLEGSGSKDIPLRSEEWREGGQVWNQKLHHSPQL
jgi:hypothetical protein